MIRKKGFNQKLKDYLTIYKIPIAPNSLDPQLFYFPEDGSPAKLLPGIQSQILNDMEILVGEQPQRIKKFYLIGETLQPGNKNRQSALKILVVLNKDLMDLDIDGILAEDLLKLANNLSNKLALGTSHPINYVLTVRPINLEEHEAVYDVFQQSWLKTPKGM